MSKPQFPISKSQSNPNFQFPIRYWLLVIYLTSVIGYWPLAAHAQNDNEIAALSKEPMEAGDCRQVFANLEKIKTTYFKDNKYNEFAQFLKSFIAQAKAPCAAPDYFLALCRFNQLKYLEESQDWNAYFSQGASLREEMQKSVEKALKGSTPAEEVNLYAKLLLWKFHKDQQDSDLEKSTVDLIDSALAYSQGGSDSAPLKDAADQLLAYGEKQQAKKIYGFYVQKLLSSKVTDQDLILSAENFYKEGNMDLAESIYDAFIEKPSKSKNQEKLLSALTEIARKFAYKDQGQKDPAYAEKIFQEIENIFGKKAFDEELMYLRGFNLEKMHYFKEAKDIYVELALRFPGSKYLDKVNFKSGIISIYALRDMKNGKPYLEALAKQEKISSYSASSLYQLGLLSQWEGNLAQAEEYYDKLIEATGAKKDNFAPLISLVQERLKEIETSNPIEYNLKTFLDVCLKNEYASLNQEKSVLVCSPYVSASGGEISVAVSSQAGGTGCSQVELQYLWSGDLGNAHPATKDSSFNAQYSHPGTKIIAAVVVSPAQIFGYALDFVDIE